VAIVTRVLLDHVDEDPSQGDHLAGPMSTGVLQRAGGHKLARLLALGVPRGEGLRYISLVDVV